MNKILCFDTSNHSCSVAISNGQSILYYEQELRPSMQAERLVVMIENALNTTKMKYKDLDYLAVTNGPGSFTGIRIGLAVAKGIIHGTKIKSIGITNFETSFYRTKQQLKSFDYSIIFLNAYRNAQYIQVFDYEGKKISKPQLINNDSVVDFIKKYNGTLACSGSGLTEIYTSIQNLDNIYILPRFKTIKAIHIARYADEKINSGLIDPIEPLYIRPPDAIIPK